MKKYIIKISTIVLVLIGFVPASASAANLYFESTRNTVSVGDTLIVSVKISSDGASINTVDGNINLASKENSFVVNDFNLAGSIFSLWPRTPSLSKDGSNISFVGGVAGGFKTDKVTLFNIVIEAASKGSITISPKDISVFANDGKGSKVPLKTSNLTIQVNDKNPSVASTNEWVNLVSKDKTAPSDFTIAIGREASLFDGKRFAFFNSIDNESGISYYEVKEGSNAVIRSGSMYVLQNQDENGIPSLSVTAYDKAGNSTTATYKEPGYKLLGFPMYIIITIIILVIIFLVLRKIRKNKKHNIINAQTTRQI